MYFVFFNVIKKALICSKFDTNLHAEIQVLLALSSTYKDDKNRELCLNIKFLPRSKHLSS